MPYTTKVVKRNPMFVAIRDCFQTSARGDVKVIKAGQTITPAQYRKLNPICQAKFKEVPKATRKAGKVKVTTLESAADQILAELAVEARAEKSTVDYSQYSNVLTDWN